MCQMEEKELCRSRAARRKLWGSLRQKWRMLGLFEINQEHDFYSLTCLMKEGLHSAVQTSIDKPAPVSKTQITDYTMYTIDTVQDYLQSM